MGILRGAAGGRSEKALSILRMRTMAHSLQEESSSARRTAEERGQGATGQADGKPNIEFAGPNVGWAIHYRKMNYTVDAGQHWLSRDIAFPASVEAFTIVRPDSGYTVETHGMVYRYRVVPIEYTAKGMLPAPAMTVTP